MTGRAKSRLMASIRSSSIGSAPLIAKTRSLSGRSGASARKVIASTKAEDPAALTRATYAFASIPTSRASLVAESTTSSPLTADRSMPIRTTGRSSTIASSLPSSSSPRVG